jgi:hypothetical protein
LQYCIVRRGSHWEEIMVQQFLFAGSEQIPHLDSQQPLKIVSFPYCITLTSPPCVYLGLAQITLNNLIGLRLADFKFICKLNFSLVWKVTQSHVLVIKKWLSLGAHHFVCYTLSFLGYILFLPTNLLLIDLASIRESGLWQ